MVVTGTPGVGKSQFSTLLAKRIGATHINVGIIALEEKFTIGTDSRRRTEIVDLEKVSRWVRRCLLETRKNVIVDGHYASAVVPKRLLRLAIVLRCEPSELLKRLRKRRFPKKKAYENIAAEILDSCLIDAVQSFGRKRVCEIDTTGKTPNMVVVEALRLLSRKISRRTGKVNWLETMNATGQLRRYMDFMNSNCTR